MRCHHCGKTITVTTRGRGAQFVHRCPLCNGYHQFTSAGHHNSGAIVYRITKVAPSPGGK